MENEKLVMSIASACSLMCPRSAWACHPGCWWPCCVLWSICGPLVLLCCSCRLCQSRPEVGLGRHGYRTHPSRQASCCMDWSGLPFRDQYVYGSKRDARPHSSSRVEGAEDDQNESFWHRCISAPAEIPLVQSVTKAKAKTAVGTRAYHRQGQEKAYLGRPANCYLTGPKHQGSRIPYTTDVEAGASWLCIHPLPPSTRTTVAHTGKATMELLPEAAAQLLYSTSPAHLCQASFALASCAVLAVAVTPSRERRLLVNYGARSQGEPMAYTAAATATAARLKDDDVLLRSVRTITSVGQVPHMWFFTFYATYILCAVFWAGQYLLDGSILRSVAGRQADLDPPRATNGHVAVAWCLMLLQAARRLYESWAFAKPSKSTMWIVHWLLGQLFYVGISVAIWVEGSGMFCPVNPISEGLGLLTCAAGALLQKQSRPWTFELTEDVLLKVAVAVPLFFFAWVSQYRCHKHLASLEKYSLPDQGMFRHLISPHYTCECLIYLSLAIVAAPEGHLYNQTLLSALFFVAVNLGVTARGTKSWYIDKFGSDKVAPKKVMIPFVY